MTLITSSVPGSSCSLRETAAALGEFGTRAAASTVGMYTTGPRPTRDNAMASTATGLMPPTALFKTMPPKNLDARDDVRDQIGPRRGLREC